MEKLWNESRVRADVAALDRLLDEGWTVTHGDGTINTKAEYLAEKGTPVASYTAKKVRQNFSAEVDKVKDPDRFSRFQNNPKQVAALKGIATGDPKLSASAALLAKC